VKLLGGGSTGSTPQQVLHDVYGLARRVAVAQDHAEQVVQPLHLPACTAGAALATALVVAMLVTRAG
jgi:hypothetical protein